MSKTTSLREIDAAQAGMNVDAESGYACVWFRIVLVNSTSVTVVDKNLKGRAITRNISFGRVSKLMSVGQMDALVHSGRASIKSDRIGILVGKRRVRRTPR